MPAHTTEKIVFLDAATLDRGDVSFEQFTRRWNCVFFPYTKPATLLERIAGATVAVTNKVVFDRKMLSAPEAGSLGLIAIAATGTNNVDLAAARELGKAVCNVAGYSTNSVVQHTFGLIFELASNTGAYSRDVRSGAWQASPIFTMLTRPVVELHGKTLGIIGYGAIGKAVARAAHGFGLEVLISSRPGSPGPVPEGRTPFADVLRLSDILSLHCPLTPETTNLIDADAISMMKPSAFLINVARGGIVNEEALAAALMENRIAGAATDVLTQEPPSSNHVLIRAASELNNLIITPHTAWTSQEARQRLLDEIAENISAFLDGKERNRVA